MAYVFRFPPEVTNLIYSMRDWRLEDVKKTDGTPSRLALKPYNVMRRKYTEPDTYLIRVQKRWNVREKVWIVGLCQDKFTKLEDWVWLNTCNNENPEIERKHGPLVYPCLSPIMNEPEDDSDYESDYGDDYGDDYDPSAIWKEFFGNSSDSS